MEAADDTPRVSVDETSSSSSGFADLGCGELPPSDLEQVGSGRAGLLGPTAVKIVRSVAQGSRSEEQVRQISRLLTLKGGSLAGFSRDVLETVCQQVSYKAVSRGSTLFSRGEEPSCVFIIATGRVSTFASEREDEKLDGKCKSGQLPFSVEAALELEQGGPALRLSGISPRKKGAHQRLPSKELPSERTPKMSCVDSDGSSPMFKRRTIMSNAARTAHMLARLTIDGKAHSLPTRAIQSLASADLTSRTPRPCSRDKLSDGTGRPLQAPLFDYIHSLADQGVSGDSEPQVTYLEAFSGFGSRLEGALKVIHAGGKPPQGMPKKPKPKSRPTISVHEPVQPDDADASDVQSPKGRAGALSFAASPEMLVFPVHTGRKSCDSSSASSSDSAEESSPVVAELQSGDVLGLRACCEGSRHTVTAISTDHCELLLIDRQVLRQAVSKELTERAAERSSALAKHFPVLRTLEKEKMERVMQLFRSSKHRRGTVLCWEGETRVTGAEDDRIQFILEGHARALRSFPSVDPLEAGGKRGPPKVKRHDGVPVRDAGTVLPGHIVNFTSQLLGGPEPLTVIIESAEAVVLSAPHGDLARVAGATVLEALRATAEDLAKWHSARMEHAAKSAVDPGLVAFRPDTSAKMSLEERAEAEGTAPGEDVLPVSLRGTAEELAAILKPQNLVADVAEGAVQEGSCGPVRRVALRDNGGAPPRRKKGRILPPKPVGDLNRWYTGDDDCAVVKTLAIPAHAHALGVRDDTSTRKERLPRAAATSRPPSVADTIWWPSESPCFGMTGTTDHVGLFKESDNLPRSRPNELPDSHWNATPSLVGYVAHCRAHSRGALSAAPRLEMRGDKGTCVLAVGAIDPPSIAALHCCSAAPEATLRRPRTLFPKSRRAASASGPTGSAAAAAPDVEEDADSQTGRPSTAPATTTATAACDELWPIALQPPSSAASSQLPRLPDVHAGGRGGRRSNKSNDSDDSITQKSGSAAVAGGEEGVGTAARRTESMGPVASPTPLPVDLEAASRCSEDYGAGLSDLVIGSGLQGGRHRWLLGSPPAPPPLQAQLDGFVSAIGLVEVLAPSPSPRRANVPTSPSPATTIAGGIGTMAAADVTTGRLSGEGSPPPLLEPPGNVNNNSVETSGTAAAPVEAEDDDDDMEAPHTMAQASVGADVSTMVDENSMWDQMQSMLSTMVNDRESACASREDSRQAMAAFAPRAPSTGGPRVFRRGGHGRGFGCRDRPAPARLASSGFGGASSRFTSRAARPGRDLRAMAEESLCTASPLLVNSIDKFLVKPPKPGVARAIGTAG